MFPREVKEFERRENSKDIPNTHCKVLKKRPTFSGVLYRNVHRVQVNDSLLDNFNYYFIYFIIQVEM